MTALPLLCLIGLLGLLSLLEAHHPGEARRGERALMVGTAALAIVVLILAISRVIALTRP